MTAILGKSNPTVLRLNYYGISANNAGNIILIVEISPESYATLKSLLKATFPT